MKTCFILFLSLAVSWSACNNPTIWSAPGHSQPVASWHRTHLHRNKQYLIGISKMNYSCCVIGLVSKVFWMSLFVSSFNIFVKFGLQLYTKFLIWKNTDGFCFLISFIPSLPLINNQLLLYVLQFSYMYWMGYFSLGFVETQWKQSLMIDIYYEY